MKKLSAIALAIALSVAVGVSPVSAKELQPSDYVAEFGQPVNADRLLNVRGKVTLHNVTRQQVFAYVSNLENDPTLYPGTISATRISGDGGVGTVYAESLYFGPELSNILATILEYKQGHWLKFKADNLLQNVSAYRLDKKGKSDVVLELESFVYVPQGITQQNMEDYMLLVFQNMITVFNTTGEAEIL